MNEYGEEREREAAQGKQEKTVKRKIVSSSVREGEQKVIGSKP
jgi:hypothetical protein